MSATTEALKDLGVPGLTGAIVGAALAHLTAKARGKEDHDRTLDLLVLQDERRAAQGAIDAVRDIRARIEGTMAGQSDIQYRELYAACSQRVVGPCHLIRSDALDARVTVLAYSIIVLGPLVGNEARYPITRSCADVEEWLKAMLRREDPPPAHMPPLSEMDGLVVVAQDGERHSVDALLKVLRERLKEHRFHPLG